MKLMKHITIALALCAIPVAAVGQVTTSCTSCTHQLSHYRGSGGFIAMATKGAKMVTWLGSCGGIVRTGELVPNSDGMVSALFSKDNGLACMAEKASFEVGPVMDGGWFWITDEMNSAVGLLVNKEVYKALKDDAVKIASAGDGVKTTAGMGAVYLKETATGRVGILPNILPKKPPAAIRPCGFTGSGSSAKKLSTSCKLGDGSAVAYGLETDGRTGAKTLIMDGARVTRPGVGGKVEYRVIPWMKPGGHFRTGSGDPRMGHAQFAANPGADTTIQTVTAVARSGNPPSELAAGSFRQGSEKYGVTIGSYNDGAKVEIGPNMDFCSETANVSLRLDVYIIAADETRNKLTPQIKLITNKPRGVGNAIAKHTVTIVCPAGSGSASSASANQGQELTPENPFPVE